MRDSTFWPLFLTPVLAQASELRKENDATAERLMEEGLAAHTPLAVPSQYAASYRVQRRMLLRKFVMVYYHSPHYNFIRLFMTAVIALIYGGCGPDHAGSALSCPCWRRAQKGLA